MKIHDIYESAEMLLESFGDFKRIAVPVYRQYLTIHGHLAGAIDAEKMIEQKIQIFRDGAQRQIITGIYKDIGYWTKKVSNEGVKGLSDWIDFVEQIQKEIDKRIPKYYTVFKSSTARMEIINLENIAAVHKLCNRMNLCLRDPNHFDAYIGMGSIYLVKTPGDRFIVVTYRYSSGYEIWDANNVQITVDKFIRLSRIPDYPKGTISTRDVGIENFIDDVVDEF